MKEKKTLFFGVGAIGAVLVLLALVAPVLMLWTVNSIAEAGGAEFYIEHNLWNWFLAFVMLGLVRGGNNR